jgi:hypothetical protein
MLVDARQGVLTALQPPRDQQCPRWGVSLLLEPWKHPTLPYTQDGRTDSRDHPHHGKVAAKQKPTDHVQRCQLWLESSVAGLSLLRFG